MLRLKTIQIQLNSHLNPPILNKEISPRPTSLAPPRRPVVGFRPFGRRLRVAPARQRAGPPGPGGRTTLPRGGPGEAQPDHAAAESATGTAAELDGFFWVFLTMWPWGNLELTMVEPWENGELTVTIFWFRMIPNVDSFYSLVTSGLIVVI